MKLFADALAFSLFGGITAVLMGGGIEFVRVLLNHARRAAFFQRGFAESVKRMLA